MRARVRAHICAQEETCASLTGACEKQWLRDTILFDPLRDADTYDEYMAAPPVAACLNRPFVDTHSLTYYCDICWQY
jgi:hypothetical protein